MKLPIGTENSRPIMPMEGMLREYIKDDFQHIEIYQNAEWCLLSKLPIENTEPK